MLKKKFLDTWDKICLYWFKNTQIWTKKRKHTWFKFGLSSLQSGLLQLSHFQLRCFSWNIKAHIDKLLIILWWILHLFQYFEFYFGEENKYRSVVSYECVGVKEVTKTRHWEHRHTKSMGVTKEMHNTEYQGKKIHWPCSDTHSCSSCGNGTDAWIQWLRGVAQYICPYSIRNPTKPLVSFMLN